MEQHKFNRFLYTEVKQQKKKNCGKSFWGYFKNKFEKKCKINVNWKRFELTDFF